MHTTNNNANPNDGGPLPMNSNQGAGPSNNTGIRAIPQQMNLGGAPQNPQIAQQNNPFQGADYTYMMCCHYKDPESYFMETICYDAIPGLIFSTLMVLFFGLGCLMYLVWGYILFTKCELGSIAYNQN